MVSINKRQMITILMIVLVIVSTSLTVNARWSNINDIGVVLTITNGKAVLSATVGGYSGVTYFTGEAVLERLNADNTYTEVERWSDLSADGRDFNWTSTRYVTKGYSYRFTFTATAYKNDVGETVSASKSAKA